MARKAPKNRCHKAYQAMIARVYGVVNVYVRNWKAEEGEGMKKE
jgi:hypothetical protein